MKTTRPGSSPHTRGAPPCSWAACPWVWDHPRIRGEHADEGLRFRASSRIIPAYAGSTIWSPALTCWPTDHPRIRGEHEQGARDLGPGGGSSPHTRGARSIGEPGALDRGIIPAYAGSTRCRSRRRGRCRDHPRIRGEHRLDIPWPQAMQGSSPHTRGARPSRRSLQAWREDHPRIRGEHRDSTAWVDAEGGSSPHTRGAHHVEVTPQNRVRIIPAYAGSTPATIPLRELDADHPRIRGEHPNQHTQAMIMFGSSPHTRGAPSGRQEAPEARRIIPAYAGSTQIHLNSTGDIRDHPRIRGEHLGPPLSGPQNRGSSPHTRGAPTPTLPGLQVLRIIPAYAGSTEFWVA